MKQLKVSLSQRNATERVAKEQAKTFFALLELADLSKANSAKGSPDSKSERHDAKEPKRSVKEAEAQTPLMPSFGGLRYNIEIHLPPTKDVEVYNAIFKSLKEHLLDA